MNLLTDKALDWATVLWQGSNDINNYDQLVLLFQRVFDHSPDGKEVSERLLYLKQGPCQGLNEELIKDLACPDEAASMDTLIHLSIKLDNVLKE